FSQLVLAHTTLLEKLLLQNFSRMGVSKLSHGYVLQIDTVLMIINNLDIVGVRLNPPETDSPLVDNPDAHLAGATSLEHLQPISRRVLQVLRRACGIQLAQLPQCPILDISRKLPARPPLPDTLRLPASKRLNHPATAI